MKHSSLIVSAVTLSLFVETSYTSIATAKIYKPCELANELVLKHKIPRIDIANWICLVRWESNFNTSAVGMLNYDGSFDHGIFQISDAYWCSRGLVDGACGAACESFENGDISDDAICARRIFRITKFKTKNGFDAWAGWKQHCANHDVNLYLANCTIGNMK